MTARRWTPVDADHLRMLLGLAREYVAADIQRSETAMAGYPDMIERNTSAARELLAGIDAAMRLEESC